MKTKFWQNKSREHHAQPESETSSVIERHCPKCWRVTLHYRHVRGGIEELTCQTPGCGYTQVYVIK